MFRWNFSYWFQILLYNTIFLSIHREIRHRSFLCSFSSNLCTQSIQFRNWILQDQMTNDTIHSLRVNSTQWERERESAWASRRKREKSPRNLPEKVIVLHSGSGVFVRCARAIGSMPRKWMGEMLPYTDVTKCLTNLTYCVVNVLLIVSLLNDSTSAGNIQTRYFFCNLLVSFIITLFAF